MVAFFMGLPPVLDYFVGFNWAAFFEAKTALLIGAFVSIFNIYLRMITTGPVGKDK